MPDWFESGGSGSRVDVVAMFDGKVGEMLLAMVEAGALLSLGLTSDGGALGVTVTVDGRWRREYFREAGQLELWAEEGMAPVLAACEDRSASSAARKRQRGPRGL